MSLLLQAVVHTWLPPWMWSRQDCKYKDQRLSTCQIWFCDCSLPPSYLPWKSRVLSLNVTHKCVCWWYMNCVSYKILFHNYQVQWVAGCYNKDVGFRGGARLVQGKCSKNNMVYPGISIHIHGSGIPKGSFQRQGWCRCPWTNLPVNRHKIRSWEISLMFLFLWSVLIFLPGGIYLAESFCLWQQSRFQSCKHGGHSLSVGWKRLCTGTKGTDNIMIILGQQFFELETGGWIELEKWTCNVDQCTQWTGASESLLQMLLPLLRIEIIGSIWQLCHKSYLPAQSNWLQNSSINLWEVLVLSYIRVSTPAFSRSVSCRGCND